MQSENVHAVHVVIGDGAELGVDAVVEIGERLLCELAVRKPQEVHLVLWPLIEGQNYSTRSDSRALPWQVLHSAIPVEQTPS